MNKKVYIITLNYNGWENTIECLESVFRSEYTNFRVIVVDNNSANRSMQYLTLWAEGLIDVWNSINNPLRKLSFPPIKKPINYVVLSNHDVLYGTIKESKIEVPLIFIQNNTNNGFAAGNNLGIQYVLKKNDFNYI